MYRAERLDGKGNIEGYYVYDGAHGILNLDPKNPLVKIVKYETLEIYLFGEWRLVSELEKPCEWKCVKLSETNEFILYDTKCNESNIWLDESVEKLAYKFCPYCGHLIKEV
jgi:hypothetical protein